MMDNIKRREAIKLLSCAAASTLIMPSLFTSPLNSIMKRVIPISGENLPVVGLGTWQTFNIGRNQKFKIYP